MNTNTDGSVAVEAQSSQPITPDPLFKVVGVFETPAEAAEAIDELKIRHFEGSDIELFCGQPGDETFDFSGAGKGILARMLRTFRNSTFDRIILNRYEAALRTDHCIVMVYIHKAERKEAAAQVLHNHKAHQVDYFGLAMTQHISDKS